MKYSQVSFQEIAPNNSQRLKASKGVVPQSPVQGMNSRSANFISANLFGGPFIVDWQLSIDENSEGKR